LLLHLKLGTYFLLSTAVLGHRPLILFILVHYVKVTINNQSTNQIASCI